MSHGEEIFDEIHEMIDNIKTVYTIEDYNRYYYGISDTVEGLKSLYPDCNLELYCFNDKNYGINQHRIDGTCIYDRADEILKSLKNGINIKTKWIDKDYNFIDEIIALLEKEI